MNVWTRFRKLLPSEAMYVGTITSIANGRARVQLPDNFVIAVRTHPGYAVNDRVFVQGGEIVGAAPDLPTYTVEV